MNQNESEYFAMYVQTQRYLDASPQKWSGVQALVRQKNILDANIQLIKDKDLDQSGTTKGMTISKNELKEQLALKLAIICGAVFAYASEAGDAELEQQSDFSLSGLVRMPDREFAQKVQVLLTLATTHLTDLADQGITEEQITEASTSADDFNELIGQPRTMVIKRSTVSGEVSDLISETTSMLSDRLDRLMLRFRVSDLPFYEGYTKARLLVG